jgi:hypothetical protein
MLSRCEICTPGYFSNSPDSKNCTLCPAGFYSNQQESFSCQSCPSGSYSENAQSICTLCQEGKWSASVSVSSEGDCQTCLPGRYGLIAGSTSSAYCLPWDDGFWSNSSGASSKATCQSCANVIPNIHIFFSRFYSTDARSYLHLWLGNPICKCRLL